MMLTKQFRVQTTENTHLLIDGMNYLVDFGTLTILGVITGWRGEHIISIRSFAAGAWLQVMIMPENERRAL